MKASNKPGHDHHPHKNLAYSEYRIKLLFPNAFNTAMCLSASMIRKSNGWLRQYFHFMIPVS